MNILTQELIDQRIVEYIQEWSDTSDPNQPLNLWIPIQRLSEECSMTCTIFRNETSFKQRGRYYKCINPDPDRIQTDYETDCDSDEDGDEIIDTIYLRPQYIPDGVKTLICNMFDLSQCILPDSLNILHCNNTQNIPPLPEGLLEIHCGNGWKTVLPSLPSSLRILDCSLSAINSLPPLPPNLEYLNYEGTDISQYIFDLPSSLKTLLCGSNGYQSLGPMPPNLEHFSCKWYEGILPEFPPTIKIIDVPKYTSTYISNTIRTFIENWQESNDVSSTILDFNPLECKIRNALESEDKRHYLLYGFTLDIPYIPDGVETVICSKSIYGLPTLPDSVRCIYYKSAYPFRGERTDIDVIRID